MSWQQQLQQAVDRPTDEGRQRRCQSATVVQQPQYRSVPSGRETALAAPAVLAQGLKSPGPTESSGSNPYLYPPGWQQRGRPHQLPHSPTWRHQLQQQQIWQQQQLQQQQQQDPPPTQQGVPIVPMHTQQQQGGSRYKKSSNRPYSRVEVSPAGPGCWENDEVASRSEYASGTFGYFDPTSGVSRGIYSSDSSRTAQRGTDHWGQQQQQQLILEQEQQRSAVQEVEEQCMQSLKSSLRVAAETNEISQTTAVKLEEQSEQLRGIRDTTVDIQENLQTSDYLLKGMKSWWGAFAQLFTSPPAAGKTKTSTTRGGDDSQQQQQSASPAQSSRSQCSKSSASRFAEAGGRSGDASARFIRSSGSGVGERQQQQQQLMMEDASSSHRGRSTASDFDVRLEQDLQKLSEMLGEMHERAVAINSNLKQQNDMLGEIEKNVDANQSSIAQQKKMLKDIMRK